MIAAPRRTTLVCLSATLPGAPIVQEWMQSVHGPVGLVEETTRPVELTQLYGLGSAAAGSALARPAFFEATHPTPSPSCSTECVTGAPTTVRCAAAARPKPTCTPERIDLIEELRRDNKLPAIWFLLSRAGCDAALAECVEDGLRLTDTDEAHAVRALALRGDCVDGRRRPAGHRFRRVG